MPLDSDEDIPRSCAGVDAATLRRMQEKIDNLPTLERLLKEADPNAYTAAQLDEAVDFVREMIAGNPQNESQILKEQRRLQKRYKQVYKKSLLLAGYKELLVRTGSGHAAPAAPSGDIEDLVASPRSDPATATSSPSGCYCPALERYLVSKAPRSQSGVLVVTVFTSAYPDGQNFSCKWNCYYCPNEPGQPRSYLLNEPGVRRANRLEFDPYLQFVDRVRSLMAIGHPADKVELLVLGGTWESYPLSYRERFMRDLFFAANTVLDDPAGPRREPLDLLQEQFVNETALCKIIGVTLETRPDTVNAEMLVQLRRFGCTRVQLGVQHTDDGILTYINRQATREDTMRAIKLLKDSCFKVDIHLMPDLPGTTPELDKAMFDDMLTSTYLQADQWKIYPCQTTPFTVIEEWYRQEKYIPYGIDNLVDVLLYAKRRVHPWIRLNRVIRDIPVDYVLAGVEVTNLRQLLANRLRDGGERCRCIRCREVKGDRAVTAKLQSAVMKERQYEASEGSEIFLSVETPDEVTLFGFMRLRLNIRNSETPFAELKPCALIRELHVYGNLISTYDDKGTRAKTQHTGVGTRLLERAEAIAREAGYAEIAVISGIGVRGYYRRRGYRLVGAHRGGFFIKHLSDGGSSGAAVCGEEGRYNDTPALQGLDVTAVMASCSPSSVAQSAAPRSTGAEDRGDRVETRGGVWPVWGRLHQWWHGKRPRSVSSRDPSHDGSGRE